MWIMKLVDDCVLIKKATKPNRALSMRPSFLSIASIAQAGLLSRCTLPAKTSMHSTTTQPVIATCLVLARK